MRLSNDLLQLAHSLTLQDPGKPKQVSLRRALSTAYYALFHMLIENAIDNWKGQAESRLGLARGFEHAGMKAASKEFNRSNWRGYDGNNVAIPSELRYVAKTFVDLQQERHRADYNRAARFNRTDARALVFQVEKAFREWEQIRTTPEANYYLVALVTGNRRRD